MIDFKNEKKVFVTNSEGNWYLSTGSEPALYKDMVASALAGDALANKCTSVAGYTVSSNFEPGISQARALNFRNISTPAPNADYQQLCDARKKRNDRRVKWARFICLTGRNIFLVSLVLMLGSFLLGFALALTVTTYAAAASLIVFMFAGFAYVLLDPPYTDYNENEWEWDVEAFTEKLLVRGPDIPAEAWKMYGSVREYVALGDGVELLIHFRKKYASPFPDESGSSRRTPYGRYYDYGQLSLRDHGGDITNEITLLMWKPE